jgi:hypothetical protein
MIACVVCDVCMFPFVMFEPIDLDSHYMLYKSYAAREPLNFLSLKKQICCRLMFRCGSYATVIKW